MITKTNLFDSNDVINCILENKISENNTKMKKQTNANVKKTELGQISKAYLVAYNLLSGLG